MKNLSSVFSDAHLRKYSKGQIVLYQGEKTTNVFQIKKGYIKVYDVTANGNEKLLLILGPNDIFPLIWTFEGSSPLHYFYETYDDAELCAIEYETLINATKASHDIALALLTYFVNRSKDLMNRIECIEATSAKHKIAQVLSYLVQAHGDQIANETFKVRIPITHQSIADMAGITRETASIQLKHLESEKLYKSTHSSIVVHIDRINTFLGQESA